MFAWMTRARKRASGRFPAPPARLRVEELESRYCPAAPVMTLNVLELARNQVQLSGHVTDENPTAVVVTFGGQASGVAVPNSSGDYSVIKPASGLGMITASGTDAEGLTSMPVLMNFTSAVPTLTLSYTWLGDRGVHLTGHVTDEFPGNRTVTFTGAASGSATTNCHGDFAVDLTASQLGPINATVADQWYQTSPAASVTLTNSAPLIQGFTGTNLGSGVWQFTGRVVDEYSPGLVVYFSGLSGLSGLTATVAADGTFSLTVDLQGQAGTVRCQVTDWWNVESAFASLDV